MNKKLLTIIFLGVICVAVIGWGVMHLAGSQDHQDNRGITQAANATSDQASVQLDAIKQLSTSTIAKTTRAVFSVLTATSTAGQQAILSRPPFSSDAKKLLTSDRLQSKFVVVSGSEIPSVGAQIFILFPSQPDAIFRAAYQATRSTTTPFILVDFDKSNDKPADIDKFWKTFGSALSDPSIGQ